MIRQPPISPLFPYTTLSRSRTCAPPPAASQSLVAGGFQGARLARGGIAAIVCDRPAVAYYSGDYPPLQAGALDPKSTHLNSSHTSTSHAVFCFYKKNNTHDT